MLPATHAYTIKCPNMSHCENPFMKYTTKACVQFPNNTPCMHEHEYIYVYGLQASKQVIYSLVCFSVKGRSGIAEESLCWCNWLTTFKLHHIYIYTKH